MVFTVADKLHAFWLEFTFPQGTKQVYQPIGAEREGQVASELQVFHCCVCDILQCAAFLKACRLAQGVAAFYAAFFFCVGRVAED